MQKKKLKLLKILRLLFKILRQKWNLQSLNLRRNRKL
nr:MAG TPA: hypothetical protein [Caudoviricetes sp.]DAU58328.1 MAG TPA: hypothetical protein [Caudoviricetes sp.]